MVNQFDKLIKELRKKYPQIKKDGIANLISDIQDVLDKNEYGYKDDIVIKVFEYFIIKVK